MLHRMHRHSRWVYCRHFAIVGYAGFGYSPVLQRVGLFEKIEAVAAELVSE